MDDKQNLWYRRKFLFTASAAILATLLPLEARAASGKPFGGLCYSPFRGSQNPNLGKLPSVANVIEDLNYLGKITSRIRTYESDYDPQLPTHCKQAGLELYLGSWLTDNDAINQASLKRLKTAAESPDQDAIKAIIVGNETILQSEQPCGKTTGHQKTQTKYSYLTKLYPHCNLHPREFRLTIFYLFYIFLLTLYPRGKTTGYYEE